MQPPDKFPNPSGIDLSRCNRPLVLIGSSVRAAAQSANCAGYNVFGIDYFADVDTQAACAATCAAAWPLEQVQRDWSSQWADWFASFGKRIPAFVVGGDRGIDANGQPTLLGRVMQLIDPVTLRIGADEAIVRQLADPDVLARIAIRARIEFPPYRTCRSIKTPANSSHDRVPKPILPNAACDLPGRWLIKRRFSSGGWGVGWAPESASSKSITIKDNELCQLWKAGRSFGVAFISDGQNAIMTGVCRSMFTAVRSQRFIYAGSYGPIRMPESIQRKLLAIGQQAVTQLGLAGLFNADVLIDRDDQIWLLEINPRWSASMECLERSWSQSTSNDTSPSSLIGWVMQIADGKSLSLSQRRVDAMSANANRILRRIIYAKRTGVFDAKTLGKINQSLQNNPAAHGFEKITICDQPRNQLPIQAGDPLVSVVCQQGSWKAGTRTQLSWRKTKRLFASLQKAVRSIDRVK